VHIYGLFEATKNDATILTEILNSDKDLRDLLKPGDTLVLDRGFRDCVKELQRSYELSVKMPELLKRGEKQFETVNANNSRLVTKVRWTVEVINTFLKNSFKALKEVPNQSLPHTHEDYKIAGSLINKFFKRLLSDAENSVAIVENMKKNINIKNELQEIVKKDKLHKKSLFVALNSDDIDDFPIYDEFYIQTNITLGSYQLKQARGYIGEFFTNEKIEIRINKTSLNYQDTKILFASIRSRHSKSTLYKVYIRYIPNTRDDSSIQSWFCTCKSGSRTVGCCSHIAAIIWYFACGKYLSNITNPGSRLLESIFPPVIKKTKKPNEKSVTKNNRKNVVNDNDEDNDYEDDDDDKDDDDYDNDDDDKNDDDDNNDDEDDDDDDDDNDDAEVDEVDQTDFDDDEEIDEEFIMQSITQTEEIQSSFKRILSVSNISTELGSKKTSTQRLINDNYIENMFDMSNFETRIPLWGGKIVDENNNDIGKIIVNTCTIDNFLLAIWVCSKLNSSIISLILFKPIIRIINSIEMNEWNKAKSIWLKEILYEYFDFDCNCSECAPLFKNHTINTFGSEYEFFLEPIINLQKYSLTSHCSSTCLSNNIAKESVSLIFEKQNGIVSLILSKKKKCNSCKCQFSSELKFLKNPPWIFIQTSGKEMIKLEDLPHVLLISNRKYQLLCVSIYRTNHFRSIYLLNNSYFLVDDLKPTSFNEKIPKIKIVTCFYYLIE
jgi:hypothetical protein